MVVSNKCIFLVMMTANPHLYDEVVPGTHITACLLSYLLFNRYRMCSPDYLESKNRLFDMDWNTCRQNLANWADKGAVSTQQVDPCLEECRLRAEFECEC